MHSIIRNGTASWKLRMKGWKKNQWFLAYACYQQDKYSGINPCSFGFMQITSQCKHWLVTFRNYIPFLDCFFVKTYMSTVLPCTVHPAIHNFLWSFRIANNRRLVICGVAVEFSPAYYIRRLILF